MRKFYYTLSLSSLLVMGACQAQTDTPLQTPEPVSKTQPVEMAVAPVVYRFASIEEAGDILTAQDDHFGNMQSKEMGVRLMDPEEPTLDKLSAQYRAAVIPFTDAEKAFLMSVIADSQSALEPIRAYLPDTVLMANISNDIEGGLPHTRGNLILFSKQVMDGYMKTKETNPDKAFKELKKLFLHELHHVLTRANADRMDDYFAIIGFKPCQFEEPEAIRLDRLTNPDATSYNHYAPVVIDETEGVIPFLRVRGAYDTNKGGTLGRYMNFGLLRVDVEDGTCTATNTTPQFIGPVPEFMELIGENTGYIIHPEETLADNFVHFMMGTPDLPNPEIPEAVGQFWSE